MRLISSGRVLIGLPTTDVEFYLQFEPSSFVDADDMRDFVTFTIADDITVSFRQLYTIADKSAWELYINGQRELDASFGTRHLEQEVVLLSSTVSEHHGGDGTYFRSELSVLASLLEDPYELVIASKLDQKALFCKVEITRDLPLATSIVFQPNCEIALQLYEQSICRKPAACPDDELKSGDDNQLSSETIRDLLNRLNSAKDCSNTFCDADTLVVDCTTHDGSDVTLNDYVKCGKCGPCNQLEFICQSGVPKYQLDACNDACSPCSPNDLVNQWSNWGACTLLCGGGTQTRTRNLKSSAELVDLNCVANIDVNTINTFEQRFCNQLCCGCKYNTILYRIIFIVFFYS